MYLPLNGAAYPACFASSGKHDAETEQQTAQHRIRPRLHNLGRRTKLDMAVYADGTDSHAEDDGLRHLAAAGNSQIAERRGEAYLGAFDQHAEPETAVRLVRILLEQQYLIDFLQLNRKTKHRQQGKTHPKI